MAIKAFPQARYLFDPAAQVGERCSQVRSGRFKSRPIFARSNLKVRSTVTSSGGMFG
jgi:hypothetical protein